MRARIHCAIAYPVGAGDYVSLKSTWNKHASIIKIGIHYFPCKMQCETDALYQLLNFNRLSGWLDMCIEFSDSSPPAVPEPLWTSSQTPLSLLSASVGVRALSLR